MDYQRDITQSQIRSKTIVVIWCARCVRKRALFPATRLQTAWETDVCCALRTDVFVHIISVWKDARMKLLSRVTSRTSDASKF